MSTSSKNREKEPLAGYQARTYDIELDEAFDKAKELISTAIHSDVRRRIGGDEQRIHTVNTSYPGLTYKHLLLPVWMLAYKLGDKTFQVVVNATTGEVQGQRPWSWIKITLTALFGAGAIGGIAYAIHYFM